MLGDEGAYKLASLVKSNGTLKKLDLRSTAIGQKGFAALFEALIYNDSVVSINVCSQKSLKGRMYMGLPGCLALEQLLKSRKNIQRLLMKNTGMVTEGIPYVVAGLKSSAVSMLTLDLSSNNLGFKDITLLSDALPHFQLLTHLYLADNQIGNAACVPLARGLKKLIALKRLDLRSNHIGLKGLTLLSDVFADTFDLHNLKLDNNLFAENSKKLMDPVLRDEEKKMATVTRALKAMGLADRKISYR